MTSANEKLRSDEDINREILFHYAQTAATAGVVGAGFMGGISSLNKNGMRGSATNGSAGTPGVGLSLASLGGYDGMLPYQQHLPQESNPSLVYYSYPTPQYHHQQALQEHDNSGGSDLLDTMRSAVGHAEHHNQYHSPAATGTALLQQTGSLPRRLDNQQELWHAASLMEAPSTVLTTSTSNGTATGANNYYSTPLSSSFSSRPSRQFYFTGKNVRQSGPTYAHSQPVAATYSQSVAPASYSQSTGFEAAMASFGGDPYLLQNHDQPYSYDPNYFTHQGAVQQAPTYKDAFDRAMALKEKIDKNKKRRRGKIADDEPRRPLSAYNFFFSEEKEFVIGLLPDLPSKTNNLTINISSMSVDEIQDYLVEAKKKCCPETLNAIRDKAEAQTHTTLSAHLEGDKEKKSHKKSHGKVGFQKLASIIGKRWRSLSREGKDRYCDLAKEDQERFKRQIQQHQPLVCATKNEMSNPATQHSPL
jgi:hypothetical protein